MTNLPLWEHQKNILNDDRNFLLLSWSCGTGKTLGLTELVKSRAFSVLILCPKALVKKWEKEMERSLPNTPYKILSPYWFKKYHKELEYYDSLLIDEADAPYFGTNQTSKALFSYLKRTNPSYVFMGTATPYRSTPMNLYNAGKICQYCPMSYPDFRTKFFFQEYFGAQPVWTPKMKHKDPAVKAETQQELNEYLRNFSDIIRMEDCFDVPKQLYPEEHIAMTPAQEKVLKKLDEYTENRSVFFHYANEIENGWLDEKALGDHMDIDSIKEEWIIDASEKHDTMVVFSMYRNQQRRLYEALKKKHKKAYVAIINGDNSSDAPEISAIVDSVAEGTHPKYTQAYLVASTGVSSGWECKYVSFAPFASLPWSYQQWEQSIGRVLRSDNLKENIYSILIGGRIDARIWQSLQDGSDYDPVKHAAAEEDVIL